MLRLRALMIALALSALTLFGLVQLPDVIAQTGEADAPTLIVAPGSGPAGTLHLIRAENLTPNTEYQIWIYAEGEPAPLFERAATSTGRGLISLNYQTDAQQAAGTYRVELSLGAEVVATAEFEVTGSSAGTPAPEGTPSGEAVGVINVEPPAGVIGTGHLISVENLTPGQAYILEVEFDGRVVFDLRLTADENGMTGTILRSDPTDTPGEYILRLVEAESGAEVATGVLIIETEGGTPVAPAETSAAPEMSATPSDATAAPTSPNQDSESAETAAPIEPDQPPAGTQRFEGQLDSETASASFEFEGTAGQVISVRMTSADFDAYLLIADASDNILMRNDNSGGDFNAEISGYTLPADGRYTIVATARQNLENGGRAESSGDFVVTLSFAREANGGAMVSGETLIGQLEAGADEAAYTFSGEEGQLVTIDLASDAFDPFVILVGPDGREIISDDDSGPSLYARIANFQLRESGEYTIEVDGFRGPTGQREISGEYRLTLIVADEAAPSFQPTGTPPPVTETPEAEIPDIPDDAPVVIYGQPFEGELTTDDQTVEVQFEGSAGDVVEIILDSADFDPNMTIIASSGEEIASDDDSGPGVNALLTGLELPESGTYTIIIDGYRGAGGDREISGTFLLTINSANAPAVTSTPSGETPDEPTDQPTSAPDSGTGTDLGIVTGDAPVTGTLNGDTQIAQYSFEASAGDVVTIDLTSADFDPFVRLLDANGNVIAEDDDGGGSSQARITEFVIPADGEYTIEVDAFRGFNGTDRVFGDYTVTLALEEGAGVPALSATPAAPTPLPTLPPTLSPTMTGTPTPFDAPDLSATPEMSVTSTLPPTQGPSATVVPTTTPTPTPTDPATDYRNAFPEYPAPPVHPGTVGDQPLLLDQPTTVTFNGTPGELYSFGFEWWGEGENGISVSVEADDTQLDTVIALLDPSGLVAGFDDDSGAEFSPEFQYLKLSRTGYYRLLIYPYIQGTSGTVTIRYTIHDEVPRIEANGSEIPLVLSSKIGQVSYVFSANAGQQLRLTIINQTLEMQEFGVRVMQGDTLITSTSLTGGVRAALDFTVPNDGDVNLFFTKYRPPSGNRIIFSLEPVE